MDSVNIATPAISLETAVEKSHRLGALDLARGLVMVLMTFSHSREYVSDNVHSNYDWFQSAAWVNQSFTDLFEQVFSNVFAPPGFFMLMGIGMVLLYHARLKQGWPIAKIAQYFLYRGLILIGLQFTILQLFEFMAEWEIYYYQGVLLALGGGMIIGGYLLYAIHVLQQNSFLKKCHVEYVIPAICILAIILFGQWFINSYHVSHATPSFFAKALFLGGKYHYIVNMDLDFTPLSWFPAVALGLIVGECIYQHRDATFNWLGRLALVLLLAYVMLRTANLLGWMTFGSYKTLTQGEPLTWESYFLVSKRPPSLTYWLFAFGFNFLMLHLFYQLEKSDHNLTFLLKPLYVFGQTALFFFIIHWFVYCGIVHLLDAKFELLRSLIFIWLLGLAILYPLCKEYAAFKFSKPANSLWRLF